MLYIIDTHTELFKMQEIKLLKSVSQYLNNHLKQVTKALLPIHLKIEHTKLFSSVFQRLKFENSILFSNASPLIVVTTAVFQRKSQEIVLQRPVPMDDTQILTTASIFILHDFLGLSAERAVRLLEGEDWKTMTKMCEVGGIE